MSSLQLSLFGAPRVERDGQPVRIRRRKGLALLAYLALTGRTHSREALATLLWPDFDHSSALSNLRRELSRLKKHTADDFFLADRNQLALNPEAAYTVDVERFQALLATVADHNHFPAQQCDTCLSALTEAVALYADDFLAGFNLPDAPGFDEWQFFQRESLRQALSDALEQLIEWHGNQAAYGEAITYARRWLALDPLHEPAHRTLMALYARDGQQAAALRQYEEALRLLEEELGVPPEAATEELYEAIRTREFPPTQSEAVVPGVLAPALPPPAERYVLEEQLAAGGQGQVFRARDQVSGEPVIVKRLRPELLTDEEGVARFVREGEALRQLNHPNIVHILDTFEADGQQCIVMEYVPGGTLRELLDEGEPLPLPQVLGIALELADALSRAHHLGIIHRDLKPENVLLAADGTPRLTDFGVAGVEAADARLTQTGAILGSPAYMSPEALRGERLTEQADIWSFGVLLFEMLSGRRPFEGEQITQVLVNILHEPAPDLEALEPELPAPLPRLVQRMLVKEREGRLASMRQVASALEAIRDGRTPRGFSPPKPEPESILSRDNDEATLSNKFKQARHDQHQALAPAGEFGNDFGKAWSRGNTALAQGKYLEAQQQFQASLRHAQAVDDARASAYAWYGMGRASLGLAHVEMAQHHLLEALRQAQASGDGATALLVVAEVAALFMAKGEPSRGLQLATFVTHHPLSMREVKVRGRELLAAVEEIPQGQVVVQTQAEKWELWPTVAELIDELDQRGAVSGRTLAARLPVPPTPFVGRERELAELRRLLLATTGNRLLTLIGPGGIGKTRLALEAARQSALAFPDGVFFVPLAPLSSADQVGAAIADNLGFQLTGAATPGQQFVDYLRDKQVLLLLDNFEHVIEAAALVAEMLAAAPNISIIVTSREALNLSVETVYPVSGLSVPAAEELAAGDANRYDAVALLLQQLRRVRPGFEPKAEELQHAVRIVRLVAGMPLALVMAAGWLEILSLGEIADEIANNLSLLEITARDIPERQRSIRAVFDYSWQRLPATEQQAFMKLSVFPGSFSRQAAQAVAGARLSTLRALVNKSFLTLSDNGRFEIHELLRHYGLQYLEAAEEREQVQERHSAYFLNAVQQREEDLKGARQLEALVEVEADLENVRTAWRWAVQMGRKALLVDSYWSLHLSFHVTGRYHDAVELFQPAWIEFAPEQDEQPDSVWRFIVPCLAYNAAYSGMATREMKRDVERCLELAENEGDPFQEANCLLALSCYALFVEQDTGVAIPFLQRCLDLFRRLDEKFSVALTLAWLGFAHGQHGELALFHTFCQESVEVALEAGNLVVASAAKHNLGFVTIAVGEYATAERYCREALDIATEIGRLQTIALAQLHLGLLHLLRGELDQARTWADKGLQIGRRINVEVTKSYAYAILSVCASLSGDGERAQRLSERSRELTASYYYRIVSDWAVAVSNSTTGDNVRLQRSWQRALSEAHHAHFPGTMTWLMPLAAISATFADQSEQAIELLALAFHHPQSAPGWLEKWSLLAALRTRLRQELGAARYEEMWDRGRQLELEATVTALLENAAIEEVTPG